MPVDKPHVDVAVALLEAGQARDQPFHGEGGRRIDVEDAHGGLLRSRLVDRGGETVEGRSDAGEQPLALLGQRQAWRRDRAAGRRADPPSDAIWRLTAPCVTPSASAARENDR